MHHELEATRGKERAIRASPITGQETLKQTRARRARKRGDLEQGAALLMPAELLAHAAARNKGTTLKGGLRQPRGRMQIVCHEGWRLPKTASGVVAPIPAAALV